MAIRIVLALSLILAAIPTVFIAVLANFSCASYAEASDNKSNFIPGTIIYSGSFGGDEANRLAKDGVFIGEDSKSNYLDLAYGNVLLMPDRDMIVSTHSAKISIGAGAVAFVMKCSNGLIVYDLGHRESKPVSVLFNKYKLDMQPGRMLVLSGQDESDFEKLESNYRSIPCYHSQRFDLRGSAVKVIAADFSISSALFFIQPLKQLAISNNPQDKLVLQNLVRTATAMNDITKTDISDRNIKRQDLNQ